MTDAPPPAAAAAARPPYIEGDWLDDRTPTSERFYKRDDNSLNGSRNNRSQARAQDGVGAILRRNANFKPITYGNLPTEANKYINEYFANNAHSRDKVGETPPPTGGTPLYSGGPQFFQVLVDIVKTLHFLFIAYIPRDFLENTVLFGARSRPMPHVISMKNNIAAQVIKVKIWGRSINAVSLDYLLSITEQAPLIVMTRIACQFVEDRLQNANYQTQVTRNLLMASNWPNTVKLVVRRLKGGVWSSDYVRWLLHRTSIRGKDANATKGLFMPIAAYCAKLDSGFDAKLAAAHVSDKIFMRPDEYVHGNNDTDSHFSRLIGERLYPDQGDYNDSESDSDYDGE